ncbi:MAG: YdeI/OmpD-associated family protein [Gemmatimonadetes bacterium]|nr:YdeI/OmpD-associated family protein [Gemmatimonadota bacterium]
MHRPDDREGRIRAPGLKAFQERRENRSGIYAYEQRRDQLEEPYAGVLMKNEAAWAFFQSQPPWYRKTVGWWVVSAKKEATRPTRLEKLIEHSRGKRL